MSICQKDNGNLMDDSVIEEFSKDVISQDIFPILSNNYNIMSERIHNIVIWLSDNDSDFTQFKKSSIEDYMWRFDGHIISLSTYIDRYHCPFNEGGYIEREFPVKYLTTPLSEIRL